jgi:selenide, water dikinase
VDREEIRLTELCSAAGCAAKMGPEALAQILRPISGFVPPERRADLLVGLAEGDDAAVLKLDAERALIFTVDFFTPVVDDPYDFGAIAAANAISDIYATGGEPLMALNVAAFPPDLAPDVIAAIIQGGTDKAAEAGCAVVGGHTIMDAEPKFGLSVVGLIHPDRLFLKTGVRPGDTIVLTKPLGAGVITTWAKEGEVDPRALKAATDSMKKLNRDAARIFARHGVRGCTDVTGFSLAGHALELAEKSDVRLEFYADALPFLPGARAAVEKGFIPGGTHRNRSYFQGKVVFAEPVDETIRALCFSPETSGGLLAAVPGDARACLRELRSAGIEASIIGRACDPEADRRIWIVSGGKVE